MNLLRGIFDDGRRNPIVKKTCGINERRRRRDVLNFSESSLGSRGVDFLSSIPTSLLPPPEPRSFPWNPLLPTPSAKRNAFHRGINLAEARRRVLMYRARLIIRLDKGAVVKTRPAGGGEGQRPEFSLVSR